MRTFRRSLVVLGFVGSLFATWFVVLATTSPIVSTPPPPITTPLLNAPLYVGLESTNIMTPDLFATIDTATGMLSVPALSVEPIGSGPFDITLNQSGSEIWVAGSTGDGVVVVDQSGQFIVQPIAMVGDWPSDVVFSKNGDQVFVPIRGDDEMAVINPVTYAVVDRYDLSSFGGAAFEPGKAAVHPCSGDIYMVDYFAPFLFQIDETNGTLIDSIEAGVSLWDVVLSQDGLTLYVTDRSSQADELIVIDTTTFTVTNRILVGDNPWGIAITPDGGKVLTANEIDGTVSIIDTATQMVIATVALDPSAAPRDIDVNREGTRAYVPSGVQNGADVIYVIDLTTNTLAGTFGLNGIDKPVVVASSPDTHSLDPLAAFSSNSPVGNPSIAMQFFDTSLNDPTGWDWDFGDGLGSSTQQNPTYAYANEGTYDVSLTATNDCGTSTITQTVKVGVDIYLPIVTRP